MFYITQILNLIINLTLNSPTLTVLKKVVYEKILYASSTGVTIGGQINKIITSSIKNPIAVVIVPYLAKNLTGGAITTAVQVICIGFIF